MRVVVYKPTPYRRAAVLPLRINLSLAYREFQSRGDTYIPLSSIFSPVFLSSLLVLLLSTFRSFRGFHFAHINSAEDLWTMYTYPASRGGDSPKAYFYVFSNSN